MELQRGMRGKLSDYFDCTQDLDILLLIDGNSEYDITCFGLDEREKLSDDRYMVFYNQTSSPQNEVQYYQEKGGIRFQVNVLKLPETIKKLVFTVSIDGTGVMHMIRSHTFDILQNGDKKLHIELTGNDFGNEKAIITVELYKKGDIWRFAVIEQGFNGGLAKLLEHFGGEEAKNSNSAPVQPVQTTPQSAETKVVSTHDEQPKSKRDKEERKDVSVGDVSGEQGNTVTIVYDAEALTTKITINGQPFDTSRINGKEIEDWVYPFMMRKVKWNGIFDELKASLGTDKYVIQFTGTKAAMEVLMEECPETVLIGLKNENNIITKANLPNAVLLEDEKITESQSSQEDSTNSVKFSVGGWVCFRDDAEQYYQYGTKKKVTERIRSSQFQVTQIGTGDDPWITLNNYEHDKLMAKASSLRISEHDEQPRAESESETKQSLDKDMLYGILSCFNCDSLNQVCNILNEYHSKTSGDKGDYGVIFECMNKFNAWKFTYTDEEEDNAAAVNKLKKALSVLAKENDSNQLILKSIKWLRNLIQDVVEEAKISAEYDCSDPFLKDKDYLESIMGNLDRSIQELESDFEGNCDKLFMFMHEIEEKTDSERSIILDILDHEFEVQDKVNDHILETIKSSEKKTDAAITTGAAVAGGLLSLIPIVGIPLAIGAGVASSKISDNKTDETAKEYREEFCRFANKIRGVFANYVIVYALWMVSEIALNELMNNIDDENTSVNIDDDNDDFFDQI